MDYLGEQRSIDQLVDAKAAQLGQLMEADWWVPAATRVLRLRPRVLALVTYLIAGAVMGWAVWRQSLPLTALAGLVALGALYVAHDEFHHYCTGNRSLSWQTFGWGLVAYLVGGALIVLLGIQGSAIATLSGTWIALVGLAAVVASCRSLSSPITWDGNPRIWTLGGVLGTLASYILATRWPEIDSVIALAVLGSVLGVVITMVGFRWMCFQDSRIWTAVGLTLLLVAVFAFIGAAWLSVDPAGWLIGFGLVLVLGLIPLSMAVPPLAETWNKFRWGVLVALGASLGALLTLGFMGELSLGQLLLVFGLCLIVAAGIVFEGLELIPVLVFGVAIAAVVTDRTDTAMLSTVTNVVDDQYEAAHIPTAKTLVAIGDSYMSGEGADRFFAGTNVKNDNECRRTSTAYPHQVAEQLGWGLEFYACSGARTANVLTTGQQQTAPDNVPQIQHLTDLLSSNSSGETVEIGAVLVSIGGNDAWFGVIAQACIAPGNCDEHRTTVLRNVKGIGNSILEVYTAVRELVDPVPVVAMAYPLIFAETGCEESPVSTEELEFLLELTEVLNDRALKSARQAGIHFYAKNVDAFKGERICETAPGEAVVNVGHFNPQEGTLLDRLNPMNWVHGSAHPKPEGHQKIVDPLTAFLEGLDGNPEPDPFARFEIVLPFQRERVSTRLLNIPDEFACGQDELPVSAIATVVELNQVEQTYLSAKADTPICYSLPDGTWSQGEFAVQDDNVAIFPVLKPDTGSTQVVVYQSRTNDAWIVNVLQFCELDPDCAHDAEAVQTWTSRQIGKKAASAAAPAAIIFLGAWLIVLEAKRNMYQRATARRNTNP